jgi:hypothetical protein
MFIINVTDDTIGNDRAAQRLPLISQNDILYPQACAEPLDAPSPFSSSEPRA